VVLIQSSGILSSGIRSRSRRGTRPMSTLFFSKNYRWGPTSDEMRPRGVYPQVPEQPPLPTEPHPGIKGYAPAFNVPHEGLPYSLYPEHVQGVPQLRWVRAGGHSVEIDEVYSCPPYAWSFMISKVRQTGKQGINARALVSQTAAMKGLGPGAARARGARGGPRGDPKASRRLAELRELRAELLHHRYPLGESPAKNGPAYDDTR
jgi:hypothetical protein